MSEEPDVVVEAETPAETPAEAPESPKEANPREQVDIAARKSGWTPREKWPGPPEEWLDAPEYILKGAGEVLPTVKAALNEAKSEIQTLRKALKDFGEHHSRTEARIRAETLANLQEQQDAAAEVGDVAKVRAITERITKEIAEVSAPKLPDEPAEAPELAAWKQANPWFDTDEIMQGAAIAVANKVTAETGLREGKAFFAEVDKRLKARFPDLYTPATNPRRQEPSAVEGDIPPRKTTGKGWSDLSAEQKEMAIFFEKNVKGFKREDYVKDVFGAAK